MPAERAAWDIALGKDFARQSFSSWDSPERIMTNTFVAYRHLDGNTEPLNSQERVKILWKQSYLAYQFPDSQPASMHRLA